jgi:hypothetical protein
VADLSRLFDPAVFFSASNPLLESTQKRHRALFEALDRAARLQISLAEQMVDLNRKRFEGLYSGGSLRDILALQQELAVEAGQSVARCAGDLAEVAVDLRRALGLGFRS